MIGILFVLVVVVGAALSVGGLSTFLAARKFEYNAASTRTSKTLGLSMAILGVILLVGSWIFYSGISALAAMM